jgi:hypothetical protein
MLLLKGQNPNDGTLITKIFLSIQTFKFCVWKPNAFTRSPNIHGSQCHVSDKLDDEIFQSLDCFCVWVGVVPVTIKLKIKKKIVLVDFKL